MHRDCTCHCGYSPRLCGRLLPVGEWCSQHRWRPYTGARDRNHIAFPHRRAARLTPACRGRCDRHPAGKAVFRRPEKQGSRPEDESQPGPPRVSRASANLSAARRPAGSLVRFVATACQQPQRGPRRMRSVWDTRSAVTWGQLAVRNCLRLPCW